MGLFVLSFVISLGLLVAFCRLAKSRFGATGVCWLSAALVIPFGFCMFSGLALQSLVTLVLTLACLPFHAKARLIVWAPVVAMVLSYGLILSLELPGLRELSRLRKEYPLQSISDRLAYETAATKLGDAGPDSQAVGLNPEVEEQLIQSEKRTEHYSPWSSRRGMLTLLHSRASDDFQVAQGFGPARMPYVRPERIELPPAEPVPLPIPQSTDPSTDVDHDSAAVIAHQADAENGAPTQTDLRLVHDSGLADFLDPERIGYVKDRDHVAGFQSHAFTKMPELVAHKDQPHEPWKVARLELVSLLKHDVPMAYVSKNLPKMDELRDAPTRPLEDFERQSIDRLRSDEDVVIDETPDRIRMVGSLRAAKNCLECHSVRRGELLGAVTYELVPVRPARKTGPQASPAS